MRCAVEQWECALEEAATECRALFRFFGLQAPSENIGRGLGLALTLARPQGAPLVPGSLVFYSGELGPHCSWRVGYVGSPCDAQIPVFVGPRLDLNRRRTMQFAEAACFSDCGSPDVLHRLGRTQRPPQRVPTMGQLQWAHYNWAPRWDSTVGPGSGAN